MPRTDTISGTALVNVAVENQLDLSEQSASPGVPSGGYVRFYAKSDGVYYKDDGGSEHKLLTTGSTLAEQRAILNAAGDALSDNLASGNYTDGGIGKYQSRRTGTYTLTANRFYCWPVYLPEATFTKVNIEVVSGDATNVIVLLYDLGDDNETLGTLLGTSAALDCTSTGAVEDTAVSWSVDAGYYWLALHAEGTPGLKAFDPEGRLIAHAGMGSTGNAASVLYKSSVTYTGSAPTTPTGFTADVGTGLGIRVLLGV